MFRFKFIVFLVVVYSVGTYQKSTPESSFYTAAVVEYSPVSEVGSNGIRGLVTENVHNYIHFIEAAVEKGADIIVFPEVGLLSYGKGLYASPVPDPRDHVSPCTNSSSGMLEEIVQLSCAARDNDIYVVINFPEVKVCDEVINGSDCVHKGTFYYNCDIVFDRQGYVVARYRKYNLFGEKEFTRTPTPDMSTFVTDFGVKFGVFTCFDILFKAPAIELVQKYNVTDVVVPEAWFSELPFLTSIQAQSQWSYAMDANLLGAGYHMPSVGSTGSGIYTGHDGPVVTTFSNSNTSSLLVAKVPKKIGRNENTFHRNDDIRNLPTQRTNPRNFLENDSEQLGFDRNNAVSRSKRGNVQADSGELVETYNPIEGLFFKKENLSKYTTLPLDIAKLSSQEKAVSVHLCSGSLCCNFKVNTSFQASQNMHRSELDTSSQNILEESSGHYRLVAYSGMRSFDGAADAGIQVCGIVSCDNESLDTCGSPPKVNVAKSTFNNITITGNFNATNAVQMPNGVAVDFRVKLIAPRQYSFTSYAIGNGKTSVTLQSKEQLRNLLTFGIFGRYFDDDVLH